MSGKYDMSISQGSDFTLGVTIKDSAGVPIDLTGHTFSGQIRKTASDSTIQASFSFTLLDQVTDTGRVDIELPAAVSSALLLDKSKSASRKITTMTYDVESEDGSGKIVRWLEGLAKISPEVTK
jgi:hypothetical protein